MSGGPPFQPDHVRIPSGIVIDWRHWHNEPLLVGGLILLGWLHAILAGPGRARLAPGAPYPRAAARRFYASLAIFYLAVGSPLDQVGERFLFSAHMLQHQLLIYPAALLFLLGLPGWMIDPVLARPILRGPLGVMTHPVTCGIGSVVVLSVWHLPMLYDRALQDKRVHVTEHVMFFGAGILYWWPLASPSRVFPPARYGAQMLYVFGVVVGMTPVFAYLVFSDVTLYATYEYAPRLVAGFSATDDQLLAGVMMKIVRMFVALGSIGWSFRRWSRESAPEGSGPAGG